jgi:putative membrane protein
MGGVYGIAAEVAPEASAALGLPFGAVFWLAADEVAVLLLGLAKPPSEYPLATHAYSLASHLVYGLTAEAVRRVVRKAL